MPPRPVVSVAQYQAVPGAETQVSQWVPLSILKGGQAANLLVMALDSPWGRKLYGKTLVKQISTAITK